MFINDIEKWMHQNDAEYTGEFFEGCLLDNFIVACKRGYAAIYERYATSNSSRYYMVFAPYKDVAAVDKLFSEFLEREEAANEL